MKRIIKVFKGKSFSSFSGFYDSFKVTVDDVEVFAWNSEVDARRYALGLRDAFIICGVKADVEINIPIELEL